MHDPFHSLCAAFDGGVSRTKLRWAEETFGECLPWLLRVRIFTPAGLGTQIECFECEDPGHLVDAHWDPASRVWRATCPAAGEFCVPEIDTDVLLFDRDAFLREIATALNVLEYKGVEIVADHLWYLGPAKLGQRRWSLLIARDVIEPSKQSKVLKAIEIGVGHGKGIVVCAEKPGFVGILTVEHAFAAFGEVLELDQSGLRGRPLSVLKVLGGKAAQDDGRTDKEISLQLFNIGLREGWTRSTLDGEAGRIEESWPEDREPAAKSTIEKHIADVHRDYRRTNSLGEFRIPKKLAIGTRVRNR